MTDPRFLQASYTVRRKVLTIAGAKFHVYGPGGELLFYSKQKAFKLKEDIRLYESEAMQEELLILKARSVIDFGVTFDVFDLRANEVVGSVRRKGMKSLLRDEWVVFDPSDAQVGTIREDGAALAILRRIHGIFALISPQSHQLEVDGMPVANIQQNRNPFVQRFDVTMSDDAAQALDPRLALGATLLISAIEGRQS